MTRYELGALETIEVKPATATYCCSRGHTWPDAHPGDTQPQGAIAVQNGPLAGLWCAQCILELFGDRVGRVTVEV